MCVIRNNKALSEFKSRSMAGRRYRPQGEGATLAGGGTKVPCESIGTAERVAWSRRDRRDRSIAGRGWMGLDTGLRCLRCGGPVRRRGPVGWSGSPGRAEGCEPRWGGATEAHGLSGRREVSSRVAGAMARSKSPSVAPADLLGRAACRVRLPSAERLAKFGHV